MRKNRFFSSVMGCIKRPNASLNIPLNIPLPSMEAFKMLQNCNASYDIDRFVAHFKQFFDLEISLLNSKNSSQGCDNHQFLIKLIETSNRLLHALDIEEPYPTLLGDLVLFKIQLQVILCYYQKQCELGQPVAKDYIRRAHEQNSDLSRVHYQSVLLSYADSNEIAKYVLNTYADAMMQIEITNLSEFIKKPFLFEHRGEQDFSYLKP